jgi:thymidylate synthase
MAASLRARGTFVQRGDIYWNVGSLHIYDRQFYLVDNFIKTGELTITKDEYEKRYGMAKTVS